MDKEIIRWTQWTLSSGHHAIYVRHLFSLRSGQEHRALRLTPSQIELVERPGQEGIFTLFKKSRGTQGKKRQKKVVVQHEISENPSRCFVRLFKLYLSKCPQIRPSNKFYLKPLKNPTEDCWFSSFPIGHTTLAGTIARLCKCAGFLGIKPTIPYELLLQLACTRAGVDEQFIIAKIGHRSLEGVRSYKRTNMEQQEKLSDILSATKRPAIQSSSASVSIVILVILSVNLF